MKRWSLAKTLVTAAVAILISTAVYLAVPKEKPAPTPSERPKIVESVKPVTVPPTVEELLAAVNAERVKAGVKPLELDPLLNKSAQMKADEIERTGVFEHVGSTGKHGGSYAGDIGVKCKLYGENLAADTTTQGAINDWLISPGHKEAMLHTLYETTGFGISQGPAYLYIVQHFCDK